MWSSGRFSREKKGKAVATASSPARDTYSDSLAGFDAIHREAMMDTVNMDSSQRALVAESARQHRGERGNDTNDAQDFARDGRGGEREMVKSLLPTSL